MAPRNTKALFSWRVFFPEFPKFANNWRCVSRYGGVLSIFAKFSRNEKNQVLLNFTYLGGKKQENRGRVKQLREKNMGKMGKRLSD